MSLKMIIKKLNLLKLIDGQSPMSISASGIISNDDRHHLKPYAIGFLL